LFYRLVKKELYTFDCIDYEQSEREMKNYFKYSILITIVLLITTSLVNVQAPPNIGTTTQPHPYESNPGATAYFMVGWPLIADRGKMYDGDLASSGSFTLGATHILRPDFDGSYTAWTNNFLYWNEETDLETLYVYSATNNAKETSTLDDVPADASGTISSVKVYVKAKRAATATSAERDQMRILMKVGASEVDSGNILPTATDATAWAYYTFTRALDPGGGSWDWSDINALEAGVIYIRVGSASTEIRASHLYVEISGPTTGFFELNTFDNTPDPSFSIGFVDIKMKYKVATALTDDTYNITYSIDGTWNTLQANTGDIFDGDGAEALRPWSQVSRPGGGSWDWTDIGTLRIRVGVTQGSGSWDAQSMYIFEVWLSVYPLPLPPSGGTPPAHLAVIPSAIYNIKATDYIFVDIYVTGVVNMTGYYLLLMFNNLTLTPTDVFIYDPFHYTAPAAPELNDTRGWVIIQQSIKAGIPKFDGSEPVARIYFTVDQWGSSKLDIINSTEFAGYPTGYFPTGVTASKLKGLWWVGGELVAVDIPYTDHDGWVSSPRYLSAIDNSGNPTTITLTWPPDTRWRELYPNYGAIWNLTSWTDNTDGVFSYCDQIDMLNATRYRHWFHIDVVTVTIHWSNSSTGEYGKAEAVPPNSTVPLSDPTLYQPTWHVIYPAANFSKTITITSWIDSDSSTTFNPSDKFDFFYDDTPTVQHWAHLDHVSHDIVISMKPIPPVYVPPAIPEFPLGTETLMALTLMITIIYLWRTRPKKRV